MSDEGSEEEVYEETTTGATDAAIGGAEVNWNLVYVYINTLSLSLSLSLTAHRIVSGLHTLCLLVLRLRHRLHFWFHIHSRPTVTDWDLPTVSCIAARCSALATAGGYQFTDPQGADLKPGSQFRLLGGWRCSKTAHGHAIRGWWDPYDRRGRPIHSRTGRTAAGGVRG
jgi:hypothetical protein